MAVVGSKAADLQAANQLNINITTITPAQSWKRQVRGSYALLYLHAQNDFLHIDDFTDFLDKFYSKHTHGNGNNGSPTTKVIEPAKVTDTNAKSLLIQSQVLGKIREGITGAVRSIEDIDKTNSRELA